MGEVYHSRFQVHPGIWVMREIVEAYGLTVSACAEELRMDACALQSLLNGHRPMGPNTALKLQNTFGVKAAILLKMQTEHDRMQEWLRREWSGSPCRSA